MSELKPIPKYITKKTLQNLYNMTEKEINASVNEFKEELRGDKYNPCERNVRDDEFDLFVIEYGNPPGYIKRIPEKERLELKSLRRKLTK